MTRGKRTTIAPGIYRDASGYAIVTKVHGVQQERRFPLSVDLDRLRLLRAEWIVARKGAEIPEPSAPYWAACQQYLKTIPANTKRHANAYNDLHGWRQTFHAVNVRDITPAMIREQLARWQTAYKPSTLNKRRQELANLFRFLGGSNPVQSVPKLKERYDDARGVSPALVEAVLAQMRDSHTKRRLRVMFETSLPPIDLTRIREADFKPKAKTIYVPERQKGAGAPALTMSLTSAGVQALQDFFAAKLEGKTFNSGSMWRDFQLAVKKAKAQWQGVWSAPENFTPYDLRHSRLTEALRRSGNLQGVQQLARHKRIETTMRYLRALEADSLKSVVASMDGAIRPVPSGEAKTRQKRPERSSGARGHR